MSLFNHVKELCSDVVKVGKDVVKVGKDVAVIGNDLNQLSLLAVTTVADKATMPIRAGATQLYNENKQLVDGAANLAQGAATQVKDGVVNEAQRAGRGFIRTALAVKQAGEATATAINDNVITPTVELIDEGTQAAKGAASAVADGAMQVKDGVVDATQTEAARIGNQIAQRPMTTMLEMALFPPLVIVDANLRGNASQQGS
jgi:hypothetical protein